MAKTTEMVVTAAIKARNKRYQDAGKPGKRVMLAKEVLRLIKMGALKPTRSVYIEAETPDRLSEEQAQPYIASGRVTCQACAKGALFVAAISIRNQLKLGQLNDEGHMDGLINNDKDGHDTFGLVTLFGENVVASIERWFEYRRDVCSDPETMLEAIMKNIVKNKGRFDATALEDDLAARDL